MTDNSIRIFSSSKGRIVEHEWTSFSNGSNPIQFDRSALLYDSLVLSAKRAVIVGCGGGGGDVALRLCRAGVQEFLLSDDDLLERINLPRHCGKADQVGLPKVDVVAEEILLINPKARITRVKKRLSPDTAAEFASYVRNCDIVLACSGSPAANRHLNQICRQEAKPVVFGGVFARAEGGFVLSCSPTDPQGGCFECIFEYTRGAQEDSADGIEHLRRDYGFDDEALHAAQGLGIDVGFVALIHAKLALYELLRGSKHSLPPLMGTLAVWDSKTLTTRWVSAKQRTGCFACDFKNFVSAPLDASNGPTDGERQ